MTADCGASGTFHGDIHFPDPGFVVISGIDAKAECHVSEGTLPAAPDGFDWGDPTFHGNPATIDSGKTVTVGITNHLNETPAPALTVDKGVSLSASGPFAASLNTTVGTTVHYRITITNTGNVALSGVTLVDNHFDLATKCEDPIPTTPRRRRPLRLQLQRCRGRGHDDQRRHRRLGRDRLRHRHRDRDRLGSAARP